MEIRDMYNGIEDVKYRCCPQNCHYFEFCVIQEGVKNISCKEITSACEWYERVNGCRINSLEMFKRVFANAKKEGVLRSPKLYEHVCEYCGKRFYNRTFEQKYCSRQCSSKGRKRTTKVKAENKKVKRICIECGKEFWQTQRLDRVRKCCSSACCGRYGNKKLQEKREKGK